MGIISSSKAVGIVCNKKQTIKTRYVLEDRKLEMIWKVIIYGSEIVAVRSRFKFHCPQITAKAVSRLCVFVLQVLKRENSDLLTALEMKLYHQQRLSGDCDCLHNIYCTRSISWYHLWARIQTVQPRLRKSIHIDRKGIIEADMVKWKYLHLAEMIRI